VSGSVQIAPVWCATIQRASAILDSAECSPALECEDFFNKRKDLDGPVKVRPPLVSATITVGPPGTGQPLQVERA